MRWLVLWVLLVNQAMAAGEGRIQVDAAWARATVAKQKVTVAYLNLTASRATRLVGGHSPLAQRVEIHEMRMQDNIMHMRALSDGLELPAGKTVRLEPGGIHLMLIGLRRQIKAGDQVPLTLLFQADESPSESLALKLPVKGLDGQ